MKDRTITIEGGTVTFMELYPYYSITTNSFLSSPDYRGSITECLSTVSTWLDTNIHSCTTWWHDVPVIWKTVAREWQVKEIVQGLPPGTGWNSLPHVQYPHDWCFYKMTGTPPMAMVSLCNGTPTKSPTGMRRHSGTLFLGVPTGDPIE